MANPAEAIEKATGHKLNLPAGKTLVVRDQTNESTVYINIPAKPNTEDVELNEDQLEAVAGGGYVTWHPYKFDHWYPDSLSSHHAHRSPSIIDFILQ